jgi:hypothetical protein
MIIELDIDKKVNDYWERVYHNLRWEVLKKNMLYDGNFNYRVVNMNKLCDKFNDAGFMFESLIRIKGTDYELFQRK